MASVYAELVSDFTPQGEPREAEDGEGPVCGFSVWSELISGCKVRAAVGAGSMET